MCGRYFLDLDFEDLLAAYDFVISSDLEGCKTGEIFPTERVAVVTPTRLTGMRWGIRPPYLKRDVINGRAETVHEKPMFKDAFFTRRVILPASAYFEWEPIGSKKIKRRMDDPGGGILSLAGISTRMRQGDDTVESVVILTCPAWPELSHIHDRMPLLVPLDRIREWLTTSDPKTTLDALMNDRRTRLRVDG